MRFNKHSDLEGLHAFLSPSQYHWINYTDEKLEMRYKTAKAAALGTKLHEYASMAIGLGIKQVKNGKTLNMFINDVIGYRMETEQPLYYSEHAFGTADAIGFRNDILRIFDLKTGVTQASPNQLYVYAALFCLEYGYLPGELQYDLRIYQNDEVQMYDPHPLEVVRIMDRIEHFSAKIDEIEYGR